MSDPIPTERWDPPAFPAPESMPTAAELESLQQSAFDEAYAAGLKQGQEDGHAQGLAAADDEIRARRELLDNALTALSAPLETLEETLEQQILQMVTQLVGRLFRRQLALDPDSIVGLVRESVALLPAAASTVQVHVHPEDAARLRELNVGGETEQQRWQLVEDPSLLRGGCRVSSGASEVDARVQARIDQLATQLLGDDRL
ncbi:MAG: flagellar assembly protein FliH [Pseudomonadota bacterium]